MKWKLVAIGVLGNENKAETCRRMYRKLSPEALAIIEKSLSSLSSQHNSNSASAIIQKGMVRWTEKEDQSLLALVEKYKDVKKKKWINIAKQMSKLSFHRTNEQCRQHYISLTRN